MAAVGAAISYPSVPFTKLASKVKWNMFRLGFSLLCSQNMKKKSVFENSARSVADRFAPLLPHSDPFTECNCSKRKSEVFVFAFFYYILCFFGAVNERKAKIEGFFSQMTVAGSFGIDYRVEFEARSRCSTSNDISTIKCWTRLAEERFVVCFVN